MYDSPMCERRCIIEVLYQFLSYSIYILSNPNADPLGLYSLA